jgi:hypothetical protein
MPPPPPPAQRPARDPRRNQSGDLASSPETIAFAREVEPQPLAERLHRNRQVHCLAK